MHILRFLLMFLILIPACTRFTNQTNRLEIDCGRIEPGHAYIKLLKPDGSSFAATELEVLSVDRAFALLDQPDILSDKACLMRKSGEKLFVRNKTKTLGRLFDFQDAQNAVALEPMKDSLPQVELGCDTTIYSDGKRFILSLVGLNEPQLNPFLNIALSLNNTTESLYQWPEQVLAQHMEYKLDRISLNPQSEYVLKAEVYDRRLGRGALVRCKLRVDPSDVTIVLGDRARNIVPYFDRNFFTVDPGYAVDFYVQKGFKDLEIEYCLTSMSYEDLSAGRWPAETCDKPKSFIKDDSVVLNNGFWMIRYRGIRGHIQGAWQSDYILVDKICHGELRPDQLLEEGCTKLEGSVFISDQPEPLPTSLRLHTVTGNVQFFRRSFVQDFTGFEHLVSIGADLDFRRVGEEAGGQILNLKGLDSLEMIGGSLRLEEIFSGQVDIGPLPRLKRIAGSLRLMGAQFGKFDGLPNLRRIGSIFISSSIFSNFSAFKNVREIDGEVRVEYADADFSGWQLEKVGSILFNEATNCRLDGFSAVATMREIDIRRCYSLKSLRGLEGLRSVKTLSISDASLTNLEGLGLTSASTVSLNGLSLTTLQGMQLAKVGTLTIGSAGPITNVDALGLLQDVDKLDVGFGTDIPAFPELRCEGFRSINISGVHGLKDLSAFHRCRNLTELSLVGFPDVTDINGLAGLENVESLNLIGLGMTSIPSWPALRVKATTLSDNKQLRDLQGLRSWNVSSVQISGNASLKDLDGLQSLRDAQNIEISGNDGLESLHGLENLRSAETLKIAATVDPEQPRGLASLRGLENLRSVGTLEISGHSPLKTLAALSQLTRAKDVSISSNDALVDLDGLQGLANVDRIAIQGNDALVRLQGLDALQSAAYLEISENLALDNLDALATLREVGELRINGNALLQNADGLRKIRRLDKGSISGNAITSLALTDLQEISENLGFFGESKLTSISFAGLKSGHLAFRRLPSLTKILDVDAFSSGTVTIETCPQLELPNFPAGVEVQVWD